MKSGDICTSLCGEVFPPPGASFYEQWILRSGFVAGWWQIPQTLFCFARATHQPTERGGADEEQCTQLPLNDKVLDDPSIPTHLIATWRSSPSKDASCGWDMQSVVKAPSKREYVSGNDKQKQIQTERGIPDEATRRN